MRFWKLSLFDDDETEKISFRNLKHVAKKLGEKVTIKGQVVQDGTFPVEMSRPNGSQ